MSQKISLAYSPDTDDAFMVLALKEGKVPADGYAIDYYSYDIQHLNEQALKSTYDITAISMAVYPDIADEYQLMPIGASIGDNFGPAIVTREDSPVQSVADLAGKKVAVPGLRTSAYFAANLLLPKYKAVPLSFIEIEPAVKSGTVDAGILIHELQLSCHEHGLRKIADLGELWQKSYQLPLPLGANAIRRNLGDQCIEELNALYHASVCWALENRREAIATASDRAIAGLDSTLAERYISMYVNDRSLRLDADVMQAMRFMIEENAKLGICPGFAAERVFTN